MSEHYCGYCEGRTPCSADPELSDYFDQCVRYGQRKERAAIVAWLRTLADPDGVIYIDDDDLARIESGAHLGGDDQPPISRRDVRGYLLEIAGGQSAADYLNGIRSETGQTYERVTIVTWLRARKHPYDHQIADVIERGGHLAGDDE